MHVEPTGEEELAAKRIKLAMKMVIRLQKAEAQVKFLQQQLDTVQDERAASFKMIAEAVGGVGMTEYQAEIDLLIKYKIDGMLQENLRVRELCAPRRCYDDKSILDDVELVGQWLDTEKGEVGFGLGCRLLNFVKDMRAVLEGKK